MKANDMSIIKAQTFENKALLLDSDGRIWQIIIDIDGQPEIQMLQRVSRETVVRLMGPDLARYIPNLGVR